MKEFALTFFDRLARRAAMQSPTLKKTRGDSFNLQEISFLRAALESVEYSEQHFSTIPVFDSDLDLLSAAVSQSKPGGLYLEFGVATGRSIRHIAQRAGVPVYGFDSFEGLPEDWRTGFAKKAFAMTMPEVPTNVSLIKGWFSDTLPVFLADRGDSVSFLHVDCDLYSSTKCIFDLLGDRISKGTVILFDEYWNYPGWKQHEFLAFEELKSARHLVCKPIGFVQDHQQVAFVVE
jgi:predicted O-methyltransferase YrrM